MNHPKLLNLVLPAGPEARPAVEEQERLFEARVNVNITYREAAILSTAQSTGRDLECIRRCRSTVLFRARFIAGQVTTS